MLWSEVWSILLKKIKEGKKREPHHSTFKYAMLHSIKESDSQFLWVIPQNNLFTSDMPTSPGDL